MGRALRLGHAREPSVAASSLNEHKNSIKVCINSGLGQVKTIFGPSAATRTD